MKKRRINILSFIMPVIILLIILQFLGPQLNPKAQLRFDEFVKLVDKNEIDSLISKGKNIEGLKRDGTSFTVFLPIDEAEVYQKYLQAPVEAGQIKYSGQEQSEPFFYQIIGPILMFGGLALFWYFMMAKSQGGNAQAMNFGKSRASLNKQDKNTITFKQVAGLKEEKEELMEIVEFLKAPQKFIAQGARIPKGVLLVGPPGTGKTYISKAVAGEAKVPFYSISGSDFVEMFVGVGASRVRDMFKEAKKNAPCIIFIDEIDAVGRRRGAGLGGGHDEREQTLNQLLVEMDGFTTNEGIIMMAATNRPDILDPALLRPGRFDRRIQIGLPDVQERYEILKVHTQNKNLSERVNLRDIAKTTVGFSPADLENITNEAALLTARMNKPEITPEIFDEATIRVIAGPEKKSRVVIEKERKLTAFHEAGHAIVAHFLEDTDPVHMITIIPRGRAGGFTSFIPEEDLSFMTKKGMFNEIVSFYGGRAAEALVLDDISTGASNDIERATKIARAMITTYGFSDTLGPIAYGQDGGDVFLGRDYGKSQDYSEKVAHEIDEEVRKLINLAYDKAKQILTEHMDFLHELAGLLLEVETIRKEEFLELAKKYDPNLTESQIQKELTEVEKELDQADHELANKGHQKNDGIDPVVKDENEEIDDSE